MTAANAHAHIVQLIIDELNDSIERGVVVHGNVASLAVEIAANLRGEHEQFLITGGEVYHVAHLQLNYHDKRHENCDAWNVYTPKEEVELICTWCKSPYSTKEPGASHKLCRDCYMYGPSR